VLITRPNPTELDSLIDPSATQSVTLCQPTDHSVRTSTFCWLRSQNVWYDDGLTPIDFFEVGEEFELMR